MVRNEKVWGDLTVRARAQDGWDHLEPTEVIPNEI